MFDGREGGLLASGRIIVQAEGTGRFLSWEERWLLSRLAYLVGRLLVWKSSGTCQYLGPFPRFLLLEGVVPLGWRTLAFSQAPSSLEGLLLLLAVLQLGLGLAPTGFHSPLW